MKRVRILSSLFLLICMALLLIAGCGSSTDPGPDNDEEDKTNPNLPTANHLIISAQAYGDPAKESSIWYMDGNQTDGFFFDGIDDYVVSTGLLSGAGTPMWQHSVTFEPRSILKVQNDRFTGAITVGFYKPKTGEDKEQGIVSLIEPNGTIQYQLVVADTSAALWFTATELFSDSIFLCVGGANVLDTSYPFLSIVYLRSDAILEVGSMAIITDLPNNQFYDVEIGMETSDITIDCYISGVKETSETKNIALYALRCPIDSLGNSEIFWSKDIIAYPGLGTTIYTGRSLALADNGMLYIAGRTEVNKDPSPASGGYWSGGLVASVSTSGDINWSKPIVLSQYSDYYYCILATDEGLYAAGKYSSFWNKPTDRVFGYGLLSKFDLTTGDQEYHLSFGDERFQTAFNTLYVEGSTAWAAGWTHAYTNDGGFQAWFATIDASTPTPTPIASERNTTETTVFDNPCSDIRRHEGAGRDIR